METGDIVTYEGTPSRRIGQVGLVVKKMLFWSWHVMIVWPDGSESSADTDSEMFRILNLEEARERAT